MKDQLNAQAQTVDSAPDVDAAQSHRLPPAVYHQTVRIARGDAEALADLLDHYPALAQEILEVASAHVGASTVRHALALHRQTSGGAPATISAADHDEIRAIAGDESYATHAEAPAPAHAPVEAAPVAAPAAAPAHAAPAWVAHARTYNAAHTELAAEFNDLTDFGCCEETDRNQLNPVDVSHWQRAHGLTADGMVGPHTVAAARANSAKNKASAIAKIQDRQAEARPPV